MLVRIFRTTLRALGVLALGMLTLVVLGAALLFCLWLAIVPEINFREQQAVYGFKLVANVVLDGRTYRGEAQTRCTATLSFPVTEIKFKQDGHTLAMALDDGRVLFIDYVSFLRGCHPRNELWSSNNYAPWSAFRAALDKATQAGKCTPVDPKTVAVYVVDDAARPRHVSVLYHDAPETALGAGGRVEQLCVEPIRDPTPRDTVAAVLPWSQSVEHTMPDPLQCYSFAWTHAVIDKSDIPAIETLDRALAEGGEGGSDRFVDLTDRMDVEEQASLYSLGRYNRVRLSDDRSMVALSYPDTERHATRYMPGPTVPWEGLWRPRSDWPFDFPWNPTFCTKDGTCFRLPRSAKGSLRRYVLDRASGNVHQLRLARMPFWPISFGTTMPNSGCPFG